MSPYAMEDVDDKALFLHNTMLILKLIFKHSRLDNIFHLVL